MFGRVTAKNDMGWSIVDTREVSPVWTILDDDPLEDLLVGPEIRGTYVFDMKKDFRSRRALTFARKQMLDQARQLECNLLIREGWRMSMMRRGESCRIEVTYVARPAQSSYLLNATKPPFVDSLAT